MNHSPGRRHRRLRAAVIALVTLATASVASCGAHPDPVRSASPSTPVAAPTAVQGTVPTPRHADVIAATHRALDYYRTSYAVATGVRNGWSWSTYVDGVHQLYRASGDADVLNHATAWGRDTAWTLTTREEEANELKAAQTYADLASLTTSASLASADARMRADLTLPDDAYTWIDALFMAMPSWARWSRRTGDDAYLETMDRLYRWTRDDGVTTTPPPGSPAFDCTGAGGDAVGLYDAEERLWYRDCSFVGDRDPDGKKVFWGRGNAWVAAAMTETLEQVLPGRPADDPQVRPYVTMLRDMAARLRDLQGADGMWRTSLSNPGRYPVPETSATGLFTYAVARGVTLGVLDRETYAPVALRAWNGLRTVSLQSSGFLSRCQNVGDRPGTPYTGAAPRTPASSTSPGTLHTDEPPFCTGAFLLAGSAVAALTDSLLVTQADARTSTGS